MISNAFALYPLALAGCALIVLVAGLARGFAGFGLSAIVVGGLSLFIAPAEAVVLAILSEVLASLGQARGIWADIRWRMLALLLGGAALGIPVGVYLLTVLDAEATRIAIAVFMALSSLALLAGARFALKMTDARTGVLGLVSGVVNGLTAMGGMPVALAFSASRMPAATLRATMIAYFFVLDTYAASLMATQGLIGGHSLVRLATLLPFLGLGIFLGTRGFHIASAETFRRLTLALMIALSVMVLGKAFLA